MSGQFLANLAKNSLKVFFNIKSWLNSSTYFVYMISDIPKLRINEDNCGT